MFVSLFLYFYLTLYLWLIGVHYVEKVESSVFSMENFLYVLILSIICLSFNFISLLKNFSKRFRDFVIIFIHLISLVLSLYILLSAKDHGVAIGQLLLGLTVYSFLSSLLFKFILSRQNEVR